MVISRDEIVLKVALDSLKDDKDFLDLIDIYIFLVEQDLAKRNIIIKSYKDLTITFKSA